jgi:hypothetical protein
MKKSVRESDFVPTSTFIPGCAQFSISFSETQHCPAPEGNGLHQEVQLEAFSLYLKQNNVNASSNARIASFTATDGAQLQPWEELQACPTSPYGYHDNTRQWCP